MKGTNTVERVEVVVIGAGQAGLSIGYQLKQRGVPFVMLDAQRRVGDVWRNRWDSLKLFTSRRLSALAGMQFPGNQYEFPTKNEMADYLEAYAARFELPIRGGVIVDRVQRLGDSFIVSAGAREIEAQQVIVAMANYQTPVTPGFATQLSTDIVQLHSTAYRNPSQLRDGPVLVVGAGNSGAEIAMELAAKGHEVVLSGRDTGHVPFNIDSFLGQRVFQPLLMRVIFHRLLTDDTPIGRKVKASEAPQTTPLIRTKPKHLTKSAVRRVGKVRGVVDGLPVTTDGETLDVANVVWCTGFAPGFSWIDLPVFNSRGEPIQRRGIVESQPGFYFTGLHFLYAMSSSMIHGLARDAEYVANAAARRWKERSGLSNEARPQRLGEPAGVLVELH